MEENPQPTGPKVSYVMGSFNHGRYVGDMVSSILTQSFSDSELVIVDDGSTDGSQNVIEQFANKDSRIRFFPRTHSGIVPTRNFGVSNARGEYLSIVDSDDELPSDWTARLVEALDSNQSAPFAYGDARLINEYGSKLGTFWDKHPYVPGPISPTLWATYCFVPAVSVMVRTAALRQSGAFWGTGGSTDYLKWIELGLIGEPVRIEGEPLGFWRRHSGNLSAASGSARADQYSELKSNLLQLYDSQDRLRASISNKAFRKRLSRLLFMESFYAAIGEDFHRAVMAIEQSLKVRVSLQNSVFSVFLSALPATMLRRVLALVHRHKSGAG